MISMKNGKRILKASTLLGSGLTSLALQAQSIPPTELAGICSYNDCATFHQCTPYHDQQNLAELNRKGIVVNALLSPIVGETCNPYRDDCTDSQERLRIKTCERSKKLAQLVLAARDL